MAQARKDLVAAALTAVAVLVFFVTHEGWNIWLIGDSHRWAAGAITILGVAACGLGSQEKGPARTLLMVLGVLAAVLAVVAIATGSLTPLSLLVVDMVLLWVVSMFEHVAQQPRPTHTT